MGDCRRRKHTPADVDKKVANTLDHRDQVDLVSGSATSSALPFRSTCSSKWKCPAAKPKFTAGKNPANFVVAARKRL